MTIGIERCLTARATHATHRAMLRCLGLSVGIAIALSGCAKTERKDDSAVKQTAYWQSALTGKLVVPCVPDGTKVITPDTPTIFRDGCPKGWHQTNVYYKGPMRQSPHGTPTKDKPHDKE